MGFGWLFLLCIIFIQIYLAVVCTFHSNPFSWALTQSTSVLYESLLLEAEQNDAFDNSEADRCCRLVKTTTERIYVYHAKLATFSSPQATNGLRLQR